jgi:hypothetical protein
MESQEFGPWVQNSSLKVSSLFISTSIIMLNKLFIYTQKPICMLCNIYSFMYEIFEYSFVINVTVDNVFSF